MAWLAAASIFKASNVTFSNLPLSLTSASVLTSPSQTQTLLSPSFKAPYIC